MTLIITKTKKNGRIILSLKGRLNAANSHKLYEALVHAFEDSKEILLDIKRLVYISSAGLRVLLMGQTLAEEKNASIQVCNVSTEIIDFFGMTDSPVC